MNQSSHCALCLGHPGHEIKVLAWAARHRPVVTILTDGSGPDRASRLESTRKVLESVGCRVGSLFGALTDREIYAMMREGPGPFLDLAARLDNEWTEQGVDTVAGDALEGFSPTHDVCRMIINSVVQRGRRRGRDFRNYSFELEKLAAPAEGGVLVDLDDETFLWKKQIVSELYPELVSEVDRIVSRLGEAPFRKEMLRVESSGKDALIWKGPEPPFYETYGARQIEKGHYDKLITYREHLLPIAEGLWEWAGENAEPCGS